MTNNENLLLVSYYDLIEYMIDGKIYHIPAPIVVEQMGEKNFKKFFDLIPIGKDRDYSFFTCPTCGTKSFYSGQCSYCQELGKEYETPKEKIKNKKIFEEELKELADNFSIEKAIKFIKKYNIKYNNEGENGEMDNIKYNNEGENGEMVHIVSLDKDAKDLLDGKEVKFYTYGREGQYMREGGQKFEIYTIEGGKYRKLEKWEDYEIVSTDYKDLAEGEDREEWESDVTIKLIKPDRFNNIRIIIHKYAYQSEDFDEYMYGEAKR